MGLHHLGQFYLSAKGVYHIPKYNSPAPLPPRYFTTFFKIKDCPPQGTSDQPN